MAQSPQFKDLGEDALKILMSLCESSTLIQLMQTCKICHKIAESELWSKVLIFGRKVHFDDYHAFCRDVKKLETNEEWRDMNYELFCETRYGEMEDLFREEDEAEDYENDYEYHVERYSDMIDEDGQFIVEFYSIFLCRHWVITDYELLLEFYDQGASWKNLRADPQSLGFDDQMLIKTFESKVELPYAKAISKYKLFEKKHMAFQGTKDSLSEFVARKKSVIASSTHTLIIASLGVHLPLIEFLRSFDEHDQLNIKSLHVSGFSVREWLFNNQFEEIEKLSRFKKLQEVGFTLDYSNYRCKSSFGSLEKIILQSVGLEYLFLNIRYDHSTSEEYASTVNFGRLIKAIPCSANMKSFAILNTMHPHIVIEDGLNALTQFKNTLSSIRLSNISFNLRELVSISQECKLKAFHLKKYVPLKDKAFPPELFNEGLLSITQNSKETLENMFLMSHFNLPIFFSPTLKVLKFLEVQISMTKFESTIQNLFEFESLRQSLEELRFIIEIRSSKEIIPSLRFRERIRKNCTKKPMPNLKKLSLKTLSMGFYSLKVNFDHDEFLEKSESSFLFNNFLVSHFPSLRYIELRDPLFRGDFPITDFDFSTQYEFFRASSKRPFFAIQF
jgi:hypothetical protein